MPNNDKTAVEIEWTLDKPVREDLYEYIVGEGLKNQKYGIEVEMTGITRAKAAKVIAGHFNSETIHVGGVYDTYTIRDNEDRQWKIVSDASIRCVNKNGVYTNKSYSVELVTPFKPCPQPQLSE